MWGFFQSRDPFRVEALHWSYEKGRLLVSKEPVAWNADVAILELQVSFHPGLTPRKKEFALRQEGSPVSLLASTVQRQGDSQTYRIVFRLPLTQAPAPVHIFWRERLLVRREIPLLTKEQFLAGLRICQPTFAACLRGVTVPCRTFPTVQCQALLATAILRSTTSLLPLSGLDLAVVFEHPGDKARDAGGGGFGGTGKRSCNRPGGRPGLVVPVQLTATQLLQQEALVTVLAPKRPRRSGTWVVSWRVDELQLASQEVHSVGSASLRRCLEVQETSYVYQPVEGGLLYSKSCPDLDQVERVGPCFVLSSRLAGLAAFVTLDLYARWRSSLGPQFLSQQAVLLTDGGAVFTPGTLPVSQCRDLVGFELYHRGSLVASLAVQPRPCASFNSEGGFQMPDSNLLGNVSDAELNYRLSQLSKGD
jgi:hypothetical protein